MLNGISRKPLFLIERENKKQVPLGNIDLKVQVMQSVASFEMTHSYSNFSDKPIEAVFFFPKDINSVITKIVCEFTLSDGTKKSLETKILEREKAAAKYDDAVAGGKTAVIGSLTQSSSDLIRIMIGLLPPLSKAVLKIFYYSQLEYEDLSHCLRIPTAFIPRYVGDTNSMIKSLTKGMFDEDVEMHEEEKKAEFDMERELIGEFAKNYPFNIEIDIQMTG